MVDFDTSIQQNRQTLSLKLQTIVFVNSQWINSNDFLRKSVRIMIALQHCWKTRRLSINSVWSIIEHVFSGLEYNYYNALACVACSRIGTHVFFNTALLQCSSKMFGRITELIFTLKTRSPVVDLKSCFFIRRESVIIGCVINFLIVFQAS